MLKSRGHHLTLLLTLTAGSSLLAAGCLSNKPAGGLDDPDEITSEPGDASMTGNEDPDDEVPATETPDSGMSTPPDDLTPKASCVFHVAAPPADETDGMDAGVDAGMVADTSVIVESSNFIGSYLADDMAKTLYIYGADLPGDCETDPVSNCVDDCLLSWPFFDASERTLPEELDDAAFGYIIRPDGNRQTTYYGWPLYYFKNDLEPGDVNGHGRGSVWFGASVALPNLVVMRSSAETGGVKYLGTDTGKTLYASATDGVGTPTEAPTSACTDTCLEAFEPFMPRSLRAVSTLAAADLEIFVRADGLGTQVAYKGLPLYTSKADVKSGDWNGVETGAWDIVLP